MTGFNRQRRDSFLELRDEYLLLGKAEWEFFTLAYAMLSSFNLTKGKFEAKCCFSAPQQGSHLELKDSIKCEKIKASLL